MGFLNFLTSRKSSGRSTRSSESIKGQAYDAVPQAQLPIQGAYPMAGNGYSNVFRNVQQYPPRSKDEIFARNNANMEPPTLTPRFRELAESMERPKTAPNGSGHFSNVVQHNKRESFKTPVASVKGHRRDPTQSSLRQPHEFGSQLDTIDASPLLPPIVPSEARSSSPRSIVSGKGFVDLLDAQSEVALLNFRNRVAATGVRDYGEDVADRNIGVNGFDLTSPQAQAFYALTGTNPCEDGESAPSPTIHREKSGDAHELRRSPSRYETLDLAMRTAQNAFINPLAQHPSYAGPAALPTRVDEQTARLSRHLSQAYRASRRQSLSSYVPSSTVDRSGTSTPRPRSVHRPTHGSQSQSSGFYGPSKMANASRDVKGLGAYFHLIPESEPEVPITPTTLTRDSVMLAKANYSLPINPKIAHESYKELASPHGMRYQPRAMARPEPLSNHGSRPNTARSLTGDSQAHTWRDIPGKPDGRPNSAKGHDDGLRMTALGSGMSASPPRVKGHRHWRTDSWEIPYPRTKSLGSASYTRHRLDEIQENIPVRTSSLNQWSVTSTTPTLSDVSSGHFARPQSHHSANTSMDMSPISIKTNNLSRPASSRADDNAALTFRPQESKSFSPPRVLRNLRGSFNIDDYLSSDDDVDADSISGVRDSRAYYEEDLVFSDTGYGGLQLPGLYDILPPMRDSAMQTPKPYIKLEPRTQARQAYVYATRGDQAPPPVPKAYTENHASTGEVSHDHEQDNEEQDADDFTLYDEAVTIGRADLAPGRKGMKRISALGNAHQRPPVLVYIPAHNTSSTAQQHPDKIDSKSAFKLRKEAKAKLRANGGRTIRVLS